MRDGDGEAHSLLQQQPLFLRLLHRHSSPTASAAQNQPSIGYHSPGLVPFLWETSPGLPKPYPAANTSNELASPCLPPPPALQSPLGFAHNRPPLPPVSPRHSFSSKVKMIIRRQRSASLDASALCSQLGSVDFSDLSDRNDTIRASKSTSSRVLVGFEKDFAAAGRSRSYRSNLEANCSSWRHPGGSDFHPSSAEVSVSSAGRVWRGLCSGSPSSLMNPQHSDSNCYQGTLSCHKQPGASEGGPEMPNRSELECPINSASHQSSSSASPRNVSSVLFPCHESTFPGEDRTYKTKIRGSRIDSYNSDENVGQVASKVLLTVEMGATIESRRSSIISMEDGEINRHQGFKGRPPNKHKRSYSLDAVLSSFNTVHQERQSREIRLQGASTELPPSKDLKSPTSKSKATCLPKMCSSTQSCAVAPSKSMSKGGI